MTDADSSRRRPPAPVHSAPPPSAPSTKARDPFLDNARGILIALVVVGHTLECFEAISEPFGETLRIWIYSFHMPAFVAISGYLSRSYRNEPRQVRRLLTAMLVPYVIFQLLHELVKMLLLGHEYQLDLVTPAWTLWFLLALLKWRLLTPVLRSLRHPLVFAVALAVLMPLDPQLGETFSLGRVFQMLPFFVLGLVTTPALLTRITSLPRRGLFGAVILVGAMAVSFATHQHLSVTRFFLRESYADGPYETWLAIIVQLLVLASGVIGTIALLMITPAGRTIWTALGVRSLTIYLLHPMILLPIRYLEEPFGWVDAWWAPFPLIVVGLALTALLSRKVVSTATSWLTDPPVGDLLVRPEEPAPGRTGRS